MNNIEKANINYGMMGATSVSEIKTLDESMKESKIDSNLGFLMMYEEWKQSILLSDGINEDENAEW